eukprot:SAG31_NODE_426_length_15814_cov_25.737066_8_plen_79_part_00
MTLHSNKVVSGSILLKGLPDGRVDVNGKWTRDKCVVTLNCQYMFGETENYQVCLNGHFNISVPASSMILPQMFRSSSK